MSNSDVVCGRLNRKAVRGCPIAKRYVDVLIERRGVEKWRPEYIFGD